MKISVRMTLFNFTCLFALTLLTFYIFYDFSRSGTLNSERDDIVQRSQAGGGRMMHGTMARGRAFPGDFLVGSWENEQLNVVQNPWELDPNLWKEGMVVENGEYFLFVKTERSGQWFLVGKNITSSIDSLERMRRVAWFLIPIIGGMVMIASYFLSEYWLKPLRDLNRRLHKISSDNLSARFPVASPLDEIEELKSALNVMLKALEDGYLIQKRFVANVSHELRTPLSTIIGYSQMLRRWGNSNPAVRSEALAAIESTAEGMKELTENLLLLSRTDQGIEKKEAMVSEILTSVVDQWKNKHPERNLLLTEEADPRIETSVGHFTILLDILLDNALKYSSQDIEISLRENELTIRDYGPGLTEELSSRLGERFYRGKNAIHQPGWGIGISLAYEIAHKLSFELIFENTTPKPGLLVTVRFGSSQPPFP